MPTISGSFTADAVRVGVTPSYVAASTGSTDAGDVWSATCHAPGAAGRLIILQVLQDGATAAAVALTGSTNINNLAGAAGWTSIGRFPVGASAEAHQHLWIGRSTSTSAPTASGTNSTSEDLYWRFYEAKDANAGATIAHVIENATLGATVNSVGTSATASDASVQTLGKNRLAVNLLAINDDNAVGSFTGETGGDWTEAVAEYANSSGTDGCIQLQTAAMASAGTVDGGTASITDSDAWGVVGFALRPITAATTTAVGEVGLETYVTNVRTNHSIKVRARVTSMAGTAVLKAALYEGTTNRSGDLSTGLLTTSLVDYDLPISDVNAAAITNYGNLSVRFWGYDDGGNYVTVEVDYIALSVPEIEITARTGTFTADALLALKVTGSFTADAEIESPHTHVEGSFAADAVLKKNITSTFSANAAIKKTMAGSAAADAVLLKGSGTKTFVADAWFVATVTGSFSANAIVKKSITSTFAADAVIRKTATGSISADAVSKKSASGTFTADAVIKATFSVSILTADVVIKRSTSSSLAANAVLAKGSSSTFVANAVIHAPRTGALLAGAIIGSPQTSSFSANAVITKSFSGSFLADAISLATKSGSFTADAVIPGAAACIWTTPEDTIQMDASPTLAFTMPTSSASNMHFEIQIDTTDTYPSPIIWKSHSDLTGWEFWDGDSWEPVPQAGVPNTYCGNEARYTVQSPLANGTYYRRVRAGVI